MTMPTTNGDEEAVRRLAAVPPQEPREEDGDEAPAASDRPSFTFSKAGLLTLPGAAGSGSGGAKASIKFEVPPIELAELISAGVIGQQAFDVQFDRYDLGQGLTIASFAGRPDEDGAARAYLTLIAPQNQLPHLAAVYKNSLFGKVGKLVLNPSQVSMEEILAKRAE